MRGKKIRGGEENESEAALLGPTAFDGEFLKEHTTFCPELDFEHYRLYFDRYYFLYRIKFWLILFLVCY